MRQVGSNKIKANSFTKRLLTTTAITATVLGLAISTASAQSAPWTDFTDVQGTASFSTSNNKTTIDQTSQTYIGTSENLDIPENYTVDINQINNQALFAAKAAPDADPTQILGRLIADGRVLIIDNNGVFFGPNSRVDASGIIATTGNITNAQILNNDFGDYEFTGLTDGSIDLQGRINVKQAGLAAFVAPTVTNSGTITATLGKVVFAAGETVTIDLYGDGLMEVEATGELADAYIENTGTISSNGGHVQITALAAKNAVDNIINLDGVTTVKTASSQGGKIILSGGSKGTVQIAGNSDVSGGKTGNITVTGENISVTENAHIKGDRAGQIKLTATDHLKIEGKIEADGAGASVETEGQGQLTITSKADIQADSATWTLKQDDANIQSNNQDGNIHATALTNSMNKGTRIVVQANADTGAGEDGDITVKSNINWTGDGNLTLNAENDVIVEAEIKSDFDVNTRGIRGAITLDAGNDIVVGAFAPANPSQHRKIQTKSGDQLWKAGNDIKIGGRNSKNVQITASKGDITFDAGNDLLFRPASDNRGGNWTRVRTDNGALSYTAGRDITMTGGATDNSFVEATATNGTLTFNAGRDVTIENGAGSGAQSRVRAGTVDITAADDFHLNQGASITSLKNGVTITANNTDGNGLTVLQIEGEIDTTAAGWRGDITLNTNGYFVEIDPTAVINTTNGDLRASSDVGFDIDAGSLINLGKGKVNITAPDVRLGADINTTGAITGTATTVAVENDTAQIKDGVGLAADGAIVTIAAGTYNENVTITQNNLTLNGANVGINPNTGSRTAETVLDGDTKTGLTIKGDNVTVDGFTFTGRSGVVANKVDSVGIKNSTFSNTTKTALSITEGSNHEITNNSFDTIGSEGLRVTRADTVNISNNVFEDVTSTAIYANQGSSHTIANNKIGLDGDAQSIGKGIIINQVSLADVNNNEIANTKREGIQLINNHNAVTVTLNTLTNTGRSAITSSKGSGTSITNNLIGTKDGLTTVGTDNIGGNGIGINQTQNATVTGNKIFDAKNTGIALSNVTNTLQSMVQNNTITNTKTALSTNNVDKATISNNVIDNTSGEGLRATKSDNLNISNNSFDNITSNAIYINQGSLNTVTNNQIGTNGTTNSVRKGIIVNKATFASVTNNTFTNTSREGIQFIGNNIGGTISSNTITNTGRAAVTASNGSAISITNNLIGTTDGINSAGIDNIGGNGIGINKTQNITVSGNTIIDAKNHGVSLSNVTNTLQSTISNNTITNAKTGLNLRNIAKANVNGNTVSNSQTQGVYMNNASEITLDNNSFTDSGTYGLRAAGANNGAITLTNNSFTDQNIGARYESGQIDLSDLDNGNSFEITSDRNGATGLQFRKANTSASLSLIGDTFGATTFDGYTNDGDFYARLDNGAFNTLTIDAQQSSFEGFSPADNAGILTPIQLLALESRFIDLDDVVDVGQIFAGTIPATPEFQAELSNLEDFFTNFPEFQVTPRGFTISIAGLNRIRQLNANQGLGGPAGLNALEPAAGGRSAEDLNNVEPAAGTQTVTCWGDAWGASDNGGSVEISYGSGLSGALSGAVSCSTF